MESSQTRRFEDRRWSRNDLTASWRHFAALDLVRQQPVLDVGGGDGLFLRMLTSKGFTEIESADLSPTAVALANEAGFRAREIDVTQPLPYETNRFGTACALDVLEHLYDPLYTLTEMARIAREIVITVPNFSYAKGRLDMLRGRVPFQSRPARGHVHWFNYDSLRRTVAASGLEIADIRMEASKRLGPLGSSLARRGPNLFAVAFAARLEHR